MTGEWLRFKTSYRVPGLDGLWRIRSMETTDMAADGWVTLRLAREGVVSAPLIGADEADNPQPAAGSPNGLPSKTAALRQLCADRQTPNRNGGATDAQAIWPSEILAILDARQLR